MKKFSKQNNKNFDTPNKVKTRKVSNKTKGAGSERFGRWTEKVARAMGTPWFLIGLSVFCLVWVLWNTYAPKHLRFDSADLGFTALTLILSLQASYAAPLILLAQNRQDDRDRVQMEQDRQRAERTLADTEYMAREIVALKLTINELASKENLKIEMKQLLKEITKVIEEKNSEKNENSEISNKSENNTTGENKPKINES